MICKSKIKLYGGWQKIQRQNYTPVEPGTVGEVVNAYKTEYGTTVALCKFYVNKKRVWVRCSLTVLEV